MKWTEQMIKFLIQIMKFQSLNNHKIQFKKAKLEWEQ